MSQSGLEIILGYLSPIRPLLSQDDVDEVQINEGGRRVFTKRRGVQQLESVELDPDGLYGAIKRIAKAAGQEVIEEEHKPLSPDFNCRFPTGERVAVMFSPHSVGGDTVTIRRFGALRMSLDEATEAGMLTREQADILKAAVESARNVIISGNLGSGKTTLMNMLVAYIGEEERILSIENPCELVLKHTNVIRWEAQGKMTQRRLLESALRHGVDRVLIGEIRGEEALEFMELLNVGLAGTITSLHANSPEQALDRLLTCCLKSPGHPPVEALKQQIGCSIDYSVHLTRDVRTGVRRVDGLVKIEGYDFSLDRFKVTPL